MTLKYIFLNWEFSNLIRGDKGKFLGIFLANHVINIIKKLGVNKTIQEANRKSLKGMKVTFICLKMEASLQYSVSVI